MSLWMSIPTAKSIRNNLGITGNDLRTEYEYIMDNCFGEVLETIISKILTIFGSGLAAIYGIVEHSN